MAAEAKKRVAIQFIRENVERLDLSATLVARRIAVSRSVLYRLFELDGGVASFIQRQRLFAMRDALSSAANTRTISVIALKCGLASSAHASRSFRQAFGTTPGAYRSSCRAAHAGAVEAAADHGVFMSCWSKRIALPGANLILCCIDT